jgi:hypothetical protein
MNSFEELKIAIEYSYNSKAGGYLFYIVLFSFPCHRKALLLLDSISQGFAVR